MYQIKLENFEGPFDLLLHLIKKEEVNIYDIPIAKITEEFLNYIKLMQVLDLELAGEFLSMAGTLLYIKAQMLLPKSGNNNDEVEEDPRKELVEKLIEYKKYKEAGIEIGNLIEQNKYVYYRKIFDIDYQIASESIEVSYKNLTLFDLLKAFKSVFERNNKNTNYQVITLFPISIEEASNKLLEELKFKRRISFFELVENYTLPNIVAFFLAILELLKNKAIIVEQNELFDDIIIYEYPQLILN